MNEHITAYLDQYLALPKPDFAVMITGEWGCGKTHFIRAYQNGKVKDSAAKLCYISLNGISSLNDIIPQLIIGLSKNRLKSSHLKYLTLGKVLLAGTMKYFSVDGSANVSDLTGFFSQNTVVIFDDLERCNVDISEVFGFLSLLIEEQHLHIILISDETKIKDKDSYFQKKEKIVGKSFELESCNEEIIPQLLTSFINPQINEIATKNFAVIQELLSELKQYIDNSELPEKNANFTDSTKGDTKFVSQTNYRIVKHIFSEFSFVFQNIVLDKRLEKWQDQIFIELMSRFFVISYLLQKGKITQEFIKQLLFPVYLEPESEEYKKWNSFWTIFGQWNMKYFIPQEVWNDIFANRLFDSAKLIDFIEQRMNPQQENWRELWSYFEKTDEEIKSCLKNVYDDIEHQKYRKPIEIIHVFATLLDMSEEGFIDQKASDIMDMANRYIDSVASSIEYDEELLETRDLLQFNGSGLGVYRADTVDVKNLAKRLLDELENRAHENKTKLFEELLTKFIDDSTSFEEWARSDQRYKDIFSGQDAQLFWNAWEKIHPSAFREIGHWFEAKIIEEQLLNHRETQVSFWSELVSLAQKYLDDHSPKRDEKSKCMYLRSFFIPNVTKMLVSVPISGRNKNGE